MHQILASPLAVFLAVGLPSALSLFALHFIRNFKVKISLVLERNLLIYHLQIERRFKRGQLLYDSDGHLIRNPRGLRRSERLAPNRAIRAR